MARGQLGTVGSGNHYVDLFTHEQDRAWIGVHFGSRGLGHKIATWFLKKAGTKDGMDVDPCVIDVNGDLGEQYISACILAENTHMPVEIGCAEKLPDSSAPR